MDVCLYASLFLIMLLAYVLFVSVLLNSILQEMMNESIGSSFLLSMTGNNVFQTDPSANC